MVTDALTQEVSPPAGADIFPVRALQALADVNVAKNIARR